MMPQKQIDSLEAAQDDSVDANNPNREELDLLNGLPRSLDYSDGEDNDEDAAEWVLRIPCPCHCSQSKFWMVYMISPPPPFI